jgi:hypothetical protein
VLSVLRHITHSPISKLLLHTKEELVVFLACFEVSSQGLKATISKMYATGGLCNTGSNRDATTIAPV